MITKALKRITLSLLHGGLLLAALGTGGSAHAATTVFSTHAKGEQASAGWFTSGLCSLGSFLTIINVAAGESSTVSNQSGGEVKDVFVAVSGFLFDSCSGPITFKTLSGFATGNSVQFAGQTLSSATLQVTMPIDEGGAIGTLTLNLSWANNGINTSYGEENFRTTTPGTVLSSRFVGGSSFADATGTIILDGSDLGLGTSNNGGFLFTSNTGSVTLTKF